MKLRISVLFLLILSFYGTILSCSKEEKPKYISAESFNTNNYNEKVAEGVVLVYFWAKWCSYCTKMSPAIDEISDEYKGKTIVGKIDIDAEPALVTQFNITSVPQVFIYKNGSIVETLKGIQTKSQLVDALKKHLSKD